MGLIRFLLALSVLAIHCGDRWAYKLVPGDIAVQSFFIVSGFYMSFVLNEKYIENNKSYKLFISNRFLRLFPIYWTVLIGSTIGSLLMGVLTNWRSFPIFFQYMNTEFSFFSIFYLMASNVFIFGQDLAMFLGLTKEGNLMFSTFFSSSRHPLYLFLIIPPTWTLGLELTFYLIAPLILRARIKFILILLLLSFALRVYLFYFLELREDPWSYRFFLTELFFFLLGYFSYKLTVWVRNTWAYKITAISLMSLVCILTFTYSIIYLDKDVLFHFSLKDVLYFLLIFLSLPVLFKTLKNNKLDSMIGELSYPMYVSHVPIIILCNGLPFSFLKHWAVIALITVMCSYFLNLFIANPLERYRQSRLKINS